MATRVTFANYPNGLQPIPAALDTAFDDALKLTIIPCTATGTNTIALTPIASVYPPTLTAYANYMQFSFVPANTTTGSATVNISGIGAKNLYLNDGATQAGSGHLVAGRFYLISYSSALNSNVGGFYVTAPGLGVSPTFTGTMTAAAANFSGAVDIAGDFSVATNKFNVTAASGNTAIAGTINVTGAATFAAATMTGLVNISGAGAGQISFPATQNASAGANVLDDYEEGTWTPSIGGNATYTTQTGTYTKVGRMVTLVGHLTINAIGTGSTGQITGAPFAAASLASGCVGFFGTSSTNVVSLSCYLNSSTINITGLTVAAAQTSDPISFFKNSADIYFSLAYQT